MNQNTFSERKTVENFIDIIGGKLTAKITRANGSVEGPWVLSNQVAAAGLNNLAARSIVTSYSPFNAIAVGSGTDTASLGSTALVNEVSRKQAQTLTTSRSTMILSNTWGGAADSITSVALSEAGIFNNTSSGQGTMLNALQGVNATLADSDILSLEMTFQIGSHAV